MATAKCTIEGEHKRSLEALKDVDMTKVRGMYFLPKSQYSWEEQYIYNSRLALTTETIKSVISTPIYGTKPMVDGIFIKKCVILADALFLDEFIDPFVIKFNGRKYLDIFPHSYVVPCFEPLTRKTRVGFVEVINMSTNALTISELMADEDVFLRLLTIQPDSISINIGVSDIMLENLSWEVNQIGKEFTKKIQDLITYMQSYF